MPALPSQLMTHPMIPSFPGDWRRRVLRAIALSCAFVSATAVAAIDFTPSFTEREIDGVVFKQLSFQENGHRITYERPPGWSCTGSAVGLQLSPPDGKGVLGTIEQSPLPTPQPLDEATLKLLQLRALSSLPAGSQAATVVAEEQNPIRIKGRDTYGVTIDFVQQGQDYRTNVLFANLEDTQLRFQLVARKADFEKFFRNFRGSLYTLLWL